MSIVAWDGGRLARLSGWTGSRDQLAQALDWAARMPSRGVDRRVELQRFLSDMKDQEPQQADPDFAGNDALARILGPGPGMAMAEIAYARALGYQIAGASRAVMSAMRGSASPSGRKVLLLLSGGWPFSLESYVRGDKPVSISRELPDNQVALKELSDTANLLGYTIYPVDVPGLASITGGSIAEDPLAGQGSFVMGQPNAQGHLDTGSSNAIPLPSTYTRTNAFREQETEGTLYYLAKQTGGKPLLNGNREIALDGASADTRSYYWLGFTPEWQRDGKSHRVAVEMTKRGLRARARQGFLDLSRGAEAGMKVESALLFGEMPDGAPLQLQLGAMTRSTTQRGAFEFPLTVDIPAEAVTVLPAEGGKYAAQAQLSLVAMDDRGTQSTMPVIRIKLSSEKPPEPGTKLRYSTTIYLHGRADQLVAAVYDPVTGNVAAGKARMPAP
jgi:VWFA-related protein